MKQQINEIKRLKQLAGLNEDSNKIKGSLKMVNGDVYDIGQTVNGVSKFIYFNDKWHYYSEDITREYEYSQEDLTKLIHDDKANEEDEVTYLGNIFEYIE
jgi:hypothetical protein